MTNSEWVWCLSDHLEGLSWSKLAGGKPFVFIQVGVALPVVVGDHVMSPFASCVTMEFESCVITSLPL